MESAVEAGVRVVRDRIAQAAARSGRRPGDVTILAAAKYVDAVVVEELVAAGVTGIAENRLDSLLAKQEAGAGGEWMPRVEWHYIGRLQSRQAAQVAERVHTIQTLCTDSAAARLASAAREGIRPRLLVQVNVDADPAKDGIAADDVDRFLSGLPDGLVVAGFMTMPAFAEDSGQSRQAFIGLRELRDRLAPSHAGRHELRLLSMGTSQDFEVAVEEGATHVRLGRVLYAPNAQV